MADISATIKELAARKAQAEQEAAALGEAISTLQKLIGIKPAPAKAAPAKPAKSTKAAKPAAAPKKRKNKLTAEARARIVEAQKKRWAKFYEVQAAKKEKAAAKA